MAGALVIGYGNPLRRDDGLGPIVGQRLAALVNSRAVQVLTPFQLAPELAEPISQAGFVLFIDASEEGMPGALTCNPVAAKAAAPAFSHNMDPAALLVLARVLYGSSPPAFALAITGEDFSHGEGLSRTVEERLPQLLQRAREIMLEYAAEPAHDDKL